MVNPETNNENPIQPSPIYSIGHLPSAFTFSLGIAMAIISIAVIILRSASVYFAGVNTYNVYYVGILPATLDIAAFIPVVSLFIALALNIRRFGVTMARFLEEMTKKVRARNIAKGRAEGRAWNKRRLEAEARGERFDEPFPGEEDSN